MKRLHRLRWKLARLLAPAAIIASPGEDEGAYVLIRSGQGRYSMLMWVKASSMDLKLDTPTRTLAYDPEHPTEYTPRTTTGRFSGTVG